MTAAYKALIYQCAQAMSPEAIERILQEPLQTDAQGFDQYLRAFVGGELTAAEKALDKKKIPSPMTLEKILRTWESLCRQRAHENSLDLLAQQLVRTPLGGELVCLLEALDQTETLYGELTYRTPKRIAELTQYLQARLPQDAPAKYHLLDSLRNGCIKGIEGCSEIDEGIRTWVYNPTTQAAIGLTPPQSPWLSWSRGISHVQLHQFFEAVAEGRVQEFVSANYALLDIPFWVELILVLRYTEGLLLEVFEQRLALDWVTIRVHLTFVALWAELAYYLRALGSSLTVPTQQVCLQTLKDFASRPYFPLYGQNLVSLSGAALGEALTYLEEGLPSEDSPAMAKIYNLLGYALREAGALAGAIKFCTAGAELAHQQGDMATQAACLVNGGRALREEGRPREALALEEKALVLTRTAGHQLGEAYTLAALGRSLSSLYRYNEALEVLTQGLQRARDLREQPCIALCLLGLGGVYEATERYSEALAVLQEALATNSQDLGMVGRTLLAQAEVQKALQNYAQAVLSGAQAMLVLRSINSPRWRKAGGLLVVLRGQGGAERFEETLKTLGANAFEVQRLLGEFTQP